MKRDFLLQLAVTMVTLIVLVTSVFAWFSNGTVASIQMFNIQTFAIEASLNKIDLIKFNYPEIDGLYLYNNPESGTVNRYYQVNSETDTSKPENGSFLEKMNRYDPLMLAIDPESSVRDFNTNVIYEIHFKTNSTTYSLDIDVSRLEDTVLEDDQLLATDCCEFFAITKEKFDSLDVGNFLPEYLPKDFATTADADTLLYHKMNYVASDTYAKEESKVFNPNPDLTEKNLNLFSETIDSKDESITEHIVYVNINYHKEFLEKYEEEVVDKTFSMISDFNIFINIGGAL